MIRCLDAALCSLRARVLLNESVPVGSGSCLNARENTVLSSFVVEACTYCRECNPRNVRNICNARMSRNACIVSNVRNVCNVFAVLISRHKHVL